ncbi:MAG: hypothetical protein GX158_07210 [Bacteroidales bacterium]|jgi:hypothetical protein|nr:hypothetical protein [Bacteroidales bacterium]
MRDFTPETYRLLLKSLLEQKYNFQPFIDFLLNAKSRSVILRHDVDARKMNSLLFAQLENEFGIKGTYYFRIIPESFDENLIKQIYDLGHEIGYHYEDVSLIAKTRSIFNVQHNNTDRDKELLIKAAIDSFSKNLEKLRRIVPVETICMHGSPLSKWDNRLLWKYYNYRDFGIKGEPYFNTDFREVLYLTDTGRRWDGEAVSVRDKAKSKGINTTSETEVIRRENSFHSTFDIINAAKENRLPDKIMLTVHPQRWDRRPMFWFRELVWQNVKNIVKGALVKIQNDKL